MNVAAPEAGCLMEDACGGLEARGPMLRRRVVRDPDRVAGLGGDLLAVHKERRHRQAHVLRLFPSDAPRRGVVASLGFRFRPPSLRKTSTIGAVCVGLDELSDGEAIRGFVGGDGDVRAHDGDPRSEACRTRARCRESDRAKHIRSRQRASYPRYEGVRWLAQRQAEALGQPQKVVDTSLLEA